MLRLLSETSQEWIDKVMQDFDLFLLDHAACEKKASAMAMGMVAHYPDRKQLVRAMIDLALEELEHFSQVYSLIEARQLQLGADEKDPYINQLLKHARHPSDLYFLDRLLLAGIIEARGCQRFHCVAQNQKDAELKQFYKQLATQEAKHHHTFVQLAHTYFSADQVEHRLQELLHIEADIVSRLPIRAAVH